MLYMQSKTPTIVIDNGGFIVVGVAGIEPATS